MVQRNRRKNEPWLWLGIGYRRGTSRCNLELAIRQAYQLCSLDEVDSVDGSPADGATVGDGAIVGIATVDTKASDTALLDLCGTRGWQLKVFSSHQLAQVDVPQFAQVVAQHMGTASVAEAAALLAAAENQVTTVGQPAAKLRLGKKILRSEEELGAVTVAIAEAARNAP
jgi:cobalt-precorrin 5A hydrolase/precorrin-3B C17-methyltransferase